MIVPTDKRVKIILVAPADFRRAVEEDAALAALIADGWTIGTTVILEDPKAPEDDRMRVALMMVRPVVRLHGQIEAQRLGRLIVVGIVANAAMVVAIVTWLVFAR